MNDYRFNVYYTHLPFINEIVKYTNGDILECGCGEGSTILLHQEIQNTNRKLVSLESNIEYFNKYSYLADSSHSLYYIEADNYDNVETGNKWVDFIQNNIFNNFDVVFLDSSPWFSRKCCFDYFLNKAKIIIIHDFDYFPNNNIIGYTTNVTLTNNNNKFQEKIECNLDGIVQNFKLYYPPDEFFAYKTGPPTLICSNILNNDEFQALITTIDNNINLYYY